MPVPDFSTGEVLTAAAMNSLSSWKLADVDFTASALVEIENVFSASYDHYEIIYTGVGSIISATSFRFHTATNTPTTASNYYRYGFYLTTGGSFINFQANAIAEAFLDNHGASAGVIASAHGKIINPYANDSRTHLYTTAFDPQAGLYINLIQQWADNTRFTGFRIICQTGTLTGNIQVRGWRA